MTDFEKIAENLLNTFVNRKMASELRYIAEDIAEDEDGFRDWNPETDFPVRVGDEEVFSALEGEGDAEPEADGEGGLNQKIDELSTEIKNVQSDGKVTKTEFMGLLTRMMDTIDVLINAKPKITRKKKAKEFDTKKELDTYLKNHPEADKSLHSVKSPSKSTQKSPEPKKTPGTKKDRGTNKDCPEGECIEDKETGVKVHKDVVEFYEKEMPDYNMKLMAGKGGVLDKAKIENAKDIKEKLNWLQKRIEDGIKESADICKMNPPVCGGNMGITRNHMPQIMDKSVKDLLNSDNEKDQRKGQAAVEAGADADDDRSVLQKLMEDVQKEGTDVKVGKVPVGELKATQSEILADKTYGIADAYLRGVPGVVKTMNDPIIISSDNHILDGHHRYSAMLTADPSFKMNVIRIGMPMKDFLMRSHEQPGVFRADIKDNIISDSEPVDLGGGPTQIKRRKKSSILEMNMVDNNKVANELLKVAKDLMAYPTKLRPKDFREAILDYIYDSNPSIWIDYDVEPAQHGGMTDPSWDAYVRDVKLDKSVDIVVPVVGLAKHLPVKVRPRELMSVMVDNFKKIQRELQGRVIEYQAEGDGDHIVTGLDFEGRGKVKSVKLAPNGKALKVTLVGLEPLDEDDLAEKIEKSLEDDF
jgi:hypothetical protein